VPLIAGYGPVGMFVASLVVSIASALIQYALMDPGTIEGGESTVSGGAESLIFQGGAANVASQGDPLPIGYGRLMVGSNIIQSTIKSVPQSISTVNLMTENPYDDSVGVADIRRAFIQE